MRITVYRQRGLSLNAHLQGARMWAVQLEKTRFTYFEIEPHTQFPEHSHEEEQITLVLQGELTFVYCGEQATLRPGDVIAIPSGAVHSAFTGRQLCKAVDAWSPVRRDSAGPDRAFGTQTGGEHACRPL